MALMNFEMQFRVRVNTRPDEVVCVTGSRKELGRWDPHGSVKLTRESTRRLNIQDSKIGEKFEDGDVWSKKVKMEGLERVEFRFFICRMFQSDNEEGETNIFIKRWETNVKPRVFLPKSLLKGNNPADEILVFGEYDGKSLVSNGWLTDQSEVHIRLHDNPIRMWKPRQRNETYSVKCTPINHSDSDEADDDIYSNLAHSGSSSVSQPTVFVSVLEKGRSVPVMQEDYGTVYTTGCYLTFIIQTIDLENTGYNLDFYVHDPPKEPDSEPPTPRHVGYSFILPLDVKRSTDVRMVAITGLKHKPIGKIQIDYLLVKPMIGHKFDMSVSYQNYWKPERGPLHVGHRGLGMSYTTRKWATVRENTVASLMSAAHHGADFVEFDVHLSKDRVPLVYHDFKVHITYKKKKAKNLNLLEIAVRDLKLAEVQSMKLSHSAAPESLDELDTEEYDPEDLQPFPTLQRCFEAVDHDTGFNIELKFPQEMQDGTHEMDPYFDLNEFVDTVLRVVFQHHNSRRIIFSSFSPDACTALRLKQNRFPVLFLTQGETTHFDHYKDIRTKSVKIGTEFSLANNLLGIDVESDLLIDDVSLIQYVKASGLVLFVWGELNNDSSMIQKLQEEGVDGIIYDKIDHFKTTGKESIFKLERSNKLELLRKFGTSPSNDDLLSSSDSDTP